MCERNDVETPDTVCQLQPYARSEPLNPPGQSSPIRLPIQFYMPQRSAVRTLSSTKSCSPGVVSAFLLNNSSLSLLLCSLCTRECAVQCDFADTASDRTLRLCRILVRVVVQISHFLSNGRAADEVSAKLACLMLSVCPSAEYMGKRTPPWVNQDLPSN